MRDPPKNAPTRNPSRALSVSEKDRIGMGRQNDLEMMGAKKASAGADLAFSNAKSLLASASILANEKIYGTANSLAILSVEEAIKAYVFAVHSVIPDLSAPFLTDVFLKHKVKHGVWMLMQMMLAYFELFINTITYYKEKEEKEDLAPGSLRSKAIEDVIATLNTWASDIPNPIAREKAWYESANTNRNRGLYVDLVNNKWVGPEEIKKEEYVQSELNATKMLEVLQAM